MEIKNKAAKMMNLSELKPYPKNAKKHDEIQIKNVMQSIKEFGIVQPLVVDKDNVLIIGHCRFEACKRLEIEIVPVIKLDDISKKEANKLRLLDNKLNESEWDFDFLQDELNDLDFLDFDIDWGLNDDVIGLDTNLNEQQAVDTDNADEGKECECPNCGFKFYL